MLWLAVFLLAAPADPAPDACPGSSPAGAVLAVARGIIEADNRRALEEVLGFYDEDAVLWPPGEPPARGLATIRNRYEELFAQFTPQLATTIAYVCVGTRVASVRGRVQGRMRSRGGKPDKTVGDAYVMVLVEIDGRWRISDLAWRPEVAKKDGAGRVEGECGGQAWRRPRRNGRRSSSTG